MITFPDSSWTLIVLFQLVHLVVLSLILIGMLKRLIYFDQQGDQGKMLMMKVLVIIVAFSPAILPAIDGLFTPLGDCLALKYSSALIPTMVCACVLSRIWWKKKAPAKHNDYYYMHNGR